MRIKGKITTWNDEKGYGYITLASGGNQLFVHITGFTNRARRPQVNQSITCAISSDKQGRPCAINATLAGDRVSAKRKPTTGSLSVVTATLFLVIVAIAVHATKLLPLVLAFYRVASLLTFIIYTMDKSAARKGAWRTKENTLHLLSLAGGWPGALVAQQKLRHKSQIRFMSAIARNMLGERADDNLIAALAFFETTLRQAGKLTDTQLQ